MAEVPKPSDRVQTWWESAQQRSVEDLWLEIHPELESELPAESVRKLRAAFGWREARCSLKGLMAALNGHNLFLGPEGPTHLQTLCRTLSQEEHCESVQKLRLLCLRVAQQPWTPTERALRLEKWRHTLDLLEKCLPADGLRFLDKRHGGPDGFRGGYAGGLQRMRSISRFYATTPRALKEVELLSEELSPWKETGACAALEAYRRGL